MSKPKNHSRNHSRQHIPIAFGSLAFLLFAIGLAQAGDQAGGMRKRDMPKHRHAATDAWRHSYARMPAAPGIPHEDDIPALSPTASPNLFETGHAPAQPGPAH